MQLIELNKSTKIYWLVVTVITLSVIREPLFFLHPRIWAEDGVIHINSVFINGLWGSLISPHLGYYSLFNNYVTTIGMKFFGLSGIAYVTTWMSFLVILLTILSPLALQSKFWNSDAKKITLILFLLISGSAEIWLNTVNSQFYFCLFTALVFLSEPIEFKGWRWIYILFMMVNAVMTGITSVALAPFFIYKYLKSPSKSSKEKFLVALIIFGACVQIYSLIYLKISSDVSRFDLSNIVNFPKGFYQNIVGILIYPGRVIHAFFVLFIPIIFLLNKEARAVENSLPLIVAIYLSALFAFLSLGMNGGGRYSYASSGLTFIFLLNLLSLKKINKFTHLLTYIFLVIILYGAALRYFETKNFYDPEWKKFTLNNIIELPENKLMLEVFPQWPNTNFVIIFSKENLDKFKK
jgi:hypothetical protein